MRTDLILRATSFRLAAIQTAIFLIMLSVSGVAAYLVIQQAISQEVQTDVEHELALLKLGATQNLTSLTRVVALRQARPGDLEYRLENGRHVRLAGDLPARPFPIGWSTSRLVEGDRPDGSAETIRALTMALPDGARLTVGEDMARGQRIEARVIASCVLIGGLVLLSGVGVGAWFTIRSLRRIEAMDEVAHAFSAGDLTARAPCRGRSGDDLDRFAASLNGLLDRTTALMGSLRQVSSDIAHDLRTPLSNHKQEIERALDGPHSIEGYQAALEAALERVDEVLATFQALLNIAQLESGALAKTFETLDLGILASRVVETYQPVAEYGRRKLGISTQGDLVTVGNPQLLAQVLSNLIDNALTHTLPGAAASVIVRGDARSVTLIVEDDGPGVPADSLVEIFGRFVRLDPSRGTPGTGLGLALVSAVAAAHGGSARSERATPGLRVLVELPRMSDSNDALLADLKMRPMSLAS